MSNTADVGAAGASRLRSAGYQRPTIRTLHLIDVENLVGGEIRTATVSRALRTYGRAIKPDKRDTVIVAIAVTHRNILSTLSAQSRSGYRFISVLGHADKDGADEALVNTLKGLRHRAPLRRDYVQTVFASGDGYFVESAKEVANEGISVVNVTGIGDRSTKWSVQITVDHRHLNISWPTDGASVVSKPLPANQSKGVPRLVSEVGSHEKMLPAVGRREIGRLLSAVVAALSDENWRELGLDTAGNDLRVARLGKRTRKIAHDNGGSVATNHTSYVLARLCEVDALKPGATHGQISQQFSAYLLRRAVELGVSVEPEKDRHAVDEWLAPN